jgi:hypothetical protein
MAWTPKTRAGKALAIAAFVAGSLTAIITCWRTLDLPIPAFAGDIEQLDRKQAETAVEVYSNKVRSYLTQPAPDNPVQKRIWQEELSKARRQLEAAEERRIELSE